MNIRELLNFGAKELERLSETNRLDASLLLGFTLKMDRAKLLACYPDNVEIHNEKTFKEYLKLRIEGHPISYILGEKEFYGYSFYLEEGVLTPRPDTEILVETAMRMKMRLIWQESMGS